MFLSKFISFFSIYSKYILTQQAIHDRFTVVFILTPKNTSLHFFVSHIYKFYILVHFQTIMYHQGINIGCPWIALEDLSSTEEDDLELVLLRGRYSIDFTVIWHATMTSVNTNCFFKSCIQPISQFKT